MLLDSPHLRPHDSSGAPNGPGRRPRARWGRFGLAALLTAMALQGFVPASGLAVMAAAPAEAQLVSPDLHITEYPLPTAGSLPGGIVAGPDGALWFYETGSNRIGRITTDGQITEYPIPTEDASQPTQGFLGVGPDGAIWFTENQIISLGRISMDGQVTEMPIDLTVRNHLPDMHSNALLGVAAGQDGALWFTGALSDSISRLDMDGQTAEYVLPTPGAAPGGIVAAPDGGLWFTEPSANQLGRISLDGAITEYPLPTPGSRAVRLTMGADAAVWFAEIGGNRIGRMSPDGDVTEYPVPGTTPGITAGPGITVGRDGAIWFTGFSSNEIGRITLDGMLERFPVPTPKSVPYHIAAGPDGALWFTEQAGNKIGRLEIPPAQAVTSTP